MSKVKESSNPITHCFKNVFIQVNYIKGPYADHILIPQSETSQMYFRGQVNQLKVKNMHVEMGISTFNL